MHTLSKKATWQQTHLYQIEPCHLCNTSGRVEFKKGKTKSLLSLPTDFDFLLNKQFLASFGGRLQKKKNMFNSSLLMKMDATVQK